MQVATRETAPMVAAPVKIDTCTCGESLMPGAPCLNIGACETADRAATAQSLQKGTAAVGRPAAWTLSGRVD